MKFEVGKDILLKRFEEKPIRRPRGFVEPILDFAAEAVTEYDLDKLIARTTIPEPHLSQSYLRMATLQTLSCFN